MTRPDTSVEIPSVVERIAGGREIQPVWLNELGGLTFQAGSIYIKWSALGVEDDLAVEAEKLRWVSPYTIVPHVIDVGADAHCQWLVTTALPGKSAVDDAWLRDPATAARGIGAGLRSFHEEVPLAGCPYDWSVESRIQSARERDLQPRIGAAPPVDPVVCHGDACAPNTLLDDAGRWAGHVDLGSMGVADRWADLAPAIMSTDWNYGRLLASEVLDGYGIEMDEVRLDFYCRLWEET